MADVTTRDVAQVSVGGAPQWEDTDSSVQCRQRHAELVDTELVRCTRVSTVEFGGGVGNTTNPTVRNTLVEADSWVSTLKTWNFN